MTSKPVVKKLREVKESEIQTLTSGVRVIIPRINHFELQGLVQMEEDVLPPIVLDEETGREFPNENDPTYLAKIEAQNMRRGLKVLDIALIGVILVDGMPDDNEWLPEVMFKSKLGLLDIGLLDLNSPIEKEYAFKKYIAFKAPEDWDKLQGKINAVEEAAAAADATFQGDEARQADSPARSKERRKGKANRN